MPFFRVTSHTLLIEVGNPTEAATIVYRKFEDRTPHGFDVVGPDAEVAQVCLDAEQQEKAITIEFGVRSRQPFDREG
jgi:hypothetical protein